MVRLLCMCDVVLNYISNKARSDVKFQVGFIILGETGFEPAPSWSRTRRTTKLRYSPAPAPSCIFSLLPDDNINSSYFSFLVNTIRNTPSSIMNERHFGLFFRINLFVSD